MDIALAVDAITPAAEYYGSVTANTKDAWDAVVWLDTRRAKPTWAELEAASVEADSAIKAEAIRAERDALIAATDYLMMPDYPISDAVREAVRVYRQALRDVTEQGGFPDVVEWPDKPKVGG